MVGFSTGGVAKGSMAAAWHSSIGNVAAGSLFAKLQSLGATGATCVGGGTVVTVVATSVCVVGVGFVLVYGYKALQATRYFAFFYLSDFVFLIANWQKKKRGCLVFDFLCMCHMCPQECGVNIAIHFYCIFCFCVRFYCYDKEAVRF